MPARDRGTGPAFAERTRTGPEAGGRHRAIAPGGAGGVDASIGFQWTRSGAVGWPSILAHGMPSIIRPRLFAPCAKLRIKGRCATITAWRAHARQRRARRHRARAGYSRPRRAASVLSRATPNATPRATCQDRATTKGPRSNLSRSAVARSSSSRSKRTSCSSSRCSAWALDRHGAPCTWLRRRWPCSERAARCM